MKKAKPITWGELKKQISKFTLEQLKMPVEIIFPCKRSFKGGEKMRFAKSMFHEK